jgi:hypothetical protein
MNPYQPIPLRCADVWFTAPYPSWWCVLFDFVVTISGVQPRSLKLNANDMEEVAL